MKGRDLIDEYLGTMRRMTLEDAQALIRQGVPLSAITAVCPALTRIRINDVGDRYEPADPTGRLAYVFPATAVDVDRPDIVEDLNPAAVVSCGAVVDLVAFSPAAPARWALRLGHATVLGAIRPQICCPEPVYVWRSVFSWFRSGCRGIVLVTPNPYE